MSRSFHHFSSEDEQLIGTLDSGSEDTGLLIVSGGNEVRSGAHAGMSKLAQYVANQGFPVFRFDRRGVGESSGENLEFMSSEQDIIAAAKQLRTLCPNLNRIVAFGNCDAATALALFGKSAQIHAYLLANPWVIENDQSEPSETPSPSAAAIRSRYWDRVKNPRSFIDLLTGKIDLSKLLKGLKQASKRQENTGLAIKLRDALIESNNRIDILIAEKDTTALAFMASWKSDDYSQLRERSSLSLLKLDSASHSFADEQSKIWLRERILECLRTP
ncbi:MAG: hydrolase 1, exosortase A system-associated [Parasphingorhabdus sp.]